MMVAYLDDFPSLLVSFLMDGLYAYAYCILLNDYWSEAEALADCIIVYPIFSLLWRFGGILLDTVCKT